MSAIASAIHTAVFASDPATDGISVFGTELASIYAAVSTAHPFPSSQTFGHAFPAAFPSTHNQANYATKRSAFWLSVVTAELASIYAAVCKPVYSTHKHTN